MAESLQILETIWIFISHGGWIFFVLLAIFIMFKLYLNEIQTQYIESIEWTYLELKPPRDNPSSFYHMEQVFIQLHALLDNWSVQERYLEGRVYWWMSLEIVSLGGRISYILRVPKKYQEFVEASFYASFPNLEITEVSDYLQNFEYDPDDASYDLFGTELVLVADESIPLRTYREFQSLKGPEASELVLDPLAPLLESFTRLSAKDFFALQIIIRPLAEGDSGWKNKAKKKVEELQGDKDFHTIDDVAKKQISAIKEKAGKQGFQTKMRLLYVAPIETFSKEAKKVIISPFKVFGSTNYNGIKPSFSPKKEYRISPTLEAPYINYFIRQRKIEVFKAFKSRSTHIGDPMYILNTEELATLYHFPITSPTSQPITAVEVMDMKQSQPPANLPIG